MSVLGNGAVVAAMLAAFGSGLAYFRAARGGNKVISLARLLLVVSLIGVALASFLLLVLILRHDYSIAYVFSYSDSSLPWYFLISSFYAGQQGSFLFWALCSAVIALVLRSHTSRRGREEHVMTVFMGIQAFFLLLVFVKSPFESIWSFFPQVPAGQIPVDGRGLNPLLQNLWMVVHPPVLFLGFAAVAVPFSLAVGGLWRRDSSILTAHGMPWVIFAAAVLGLGIMLGAYWAYGVLGWGGYWGWDPVENSSLIPWLTSVALLHTLLAQLRTGKYVRTNFVLSIVSFTLVIYSTFLTRSGVLGDASVHAFTDPGAGVYALLLVLIGLVVVTGGGMLIGRWKSLKAGGSDTLLLTRETSLGAAMLVLLLSAAVILFGTSLPILSHLKFLSRTAVDASFYDGTNLWIAIAIGVLIGISLYTQWAMQDVRLTLSRAWRSIAAAVTLTGILYVAGVRDIAMVLFAFAALFALASNVHIGLKVLKGDPWFLGGKVAHIGLALFLLGVMSTGKYSSTQHVSLPLNTPTSALGYTLTYTGYTQRPDGKYAFHVVAERGGERIRLAPVMFDAGEQGVMKTPDISTSATADFYLSPVSLVDEHGGAARYTLEKGKSLAINGANVTFTRFDMASHDRAVTSPGGMTIGSVLEISEGETRETLAPRTEFNAGAGANPTPAQSKLLRASVQLVSLNVGSGSAPSTVTIEVSGAGDAPSNPETLVVEASVKPFISLLWAGTAVLMVGFVVSMVKRSRES